MAWEVRKCWDVCMHLFYFVLFENGCHLETLQGAAATVDICLQMRHTSYIYHLISTIKIKITVQEIKASTHRKKTSRLIASSTESTL